MKKISLLEFIEKYRPEIRLENYHRATLEKLMTMDFSKLEERITGHIIHSAFEKAIKEGTVVIGVDFGEGDHTSVCIGHTPGKLSGLKPDLFIVDDLYNWPVEPEEEKKAGPHRANVGTQGKKHPLPHWLGKRRY